MCQLSNQLKFCTCQELSPQEGNRWTIYRRKAGWMKVGQAIYDPNTLDLKEIEVDHLIKRLNQGGLFDFDYVPLEEDKLEIQLQFNDLTAERCFIFKNGGWERYQLFGALELLHEMEFDLPPYVSKYQGIIKHPFEW